MNREKIETEIQELSNDAPFYVKLGNGFLDFLSDPRVQKITFEICSAYFKQRFQNLNEDRKWRSKVKLVEKAIKSGCDIKIEGDSITVTKLAYDSQFLQV